MRQWILILLLMCMPHAAWAASITDASWLAGRWVGEGFGGTIEETWAPAVGGQMVGHFRLIVEGRPHLYELMLLDEQPRGLRLRVKHFNPDFIGWEDKTGWHSFEPVNASSGLLAFDGLSIARTGSDLEINIRTKSKDGKITDHMLRLKRAPM